MKDAEATTQDYGKVIFYDPYTDKGDDANDGRTPETPVRTPGRVLALASASKTATIIIEWNGKEWGCTLEEEL